MTQDNEDGVRLRVYPTLPAEVVVDLPSPWAEPELKEAMKAMSDEEKAQMVDEALEHDEFQAWNWEEP